VGEDMTRHGEGLGFISSFLLQGTIGASVGPEEPNATVQVEAGFAQLRYREAGASTLVWPGIGQRIDCDLRRP
jgi:hypothetical protein